MDILVRKRSYHHILYHENICGYYLEDNDRYTYILIQRTLFDLSDVSDLSDLLFSPLSDGAVRTSVRGAERRDV